MLFGRERIESLEKLTIRLSGMRSMEEYEAICDGESAEVSHYIISYMERDSRELLSRAEVSAHAFMELLDGYDMMGWDGFSGKHPRFVNDGTMFDLRAVANGRSIHASGSENFPRGFMDLVRDLRGIARGERTL